MPSCGGRSSRRGLKSNGTLTHLYNQRPAWLVHAHQVLDEAVAATYGWPVDLSDEEVLRRLAKAKRAKCAKKIQGAMIERGDFRQISQISHALFPLRIFRWFGFCLSGLTVYTDPLSGIATLTGSQSFVG